FSTTVEYIWEESRFVTRRLSPLKVDEVELSNTRAQFDQILDNNPFLRQSVEQQFIAGLLYSFSYIGLSAAHEGGQLNFQFNFDMAGNTVSLLGKEQPDGIETFLGLKYAQYVKGDIETSYHYNLGRSRNTTLAGHIFAGL